MRGLGERTNHSCVQGGGRAEKGEEGGMERREGGEGGMSLSLHRKSR